MAKVISSSEFQSEVLESPTPVVVDFFATWCMPCKMLEPVLEEVAEEAGEKLKLVKVDIDQEPELANKYNIRSVPTVLFMKNGEIADQMLGAAPKAVFMDKLGGLI